jgi:hypothetical protein
MKSRLQDRYDWIGLGNHPAVYWAAIQFLKLGLSALVVPRLSNLGGVAGSPHQANWVPLSNWVPLWAHRDLQDYSSTHHHQVQILTAQRRFQIKSNTLNANVDDDWNSEFKIQYGHLPPATVAETQQPHLRDLIKGLAHIARGHDLSPALPNDALKLMHAARDQLWIPGGRKMLTGLYRAEVEALGGVVADQESCQQILLDSNGFKGIQLQDHSTTIASSMALLGTNVEWAQGLSTAKNSHHDTDGAFQSSPTGWWFTLNFKVRSESVPVGTTQMMVYAVDGSPVIEIENRTGDSVGTASVLSGEVQSWSARTLLPFQSISLSREYQRKIAQRLFKVVGQYFPFIEYSITDLSPDLRDPEQVENVDLVQAYPFRDLSSIPPHLLCYGGTGLGHRTSFTGFSLAYEESYPRLGDRGSYYAAASVIADWIKQQPKPQKEVPAAVNDVLRLA